MRNQLPNPAVELIVLTRYQFPAASHHDRDAGAVHFKRKPAGGRLVRHQKTPPDEAELNGLQSEPGDSRIEPEEVKQRGNSY
jgi:hypothetical protein